LEQARGWEGKFFAWLSPGWWRLAVRRPGDAVYQLGILVDTLAHYEQSDPLERDMMRPRLLRAFGWKLASVLAKDWHADRDAELQGLLHLLAENTAANLLKISGQQGIRD
jgi:hypothetical protein